MMPHPDPRVSIVINNYNYGRFLPDAIDSALAQQYPRVEVIVVDDGSTDNSRAIIAGYGERIIPVLKPNGGQASAFNAGFGVCRGAIVIFLDADDLLLPDTAARVVAAFAADPRTAKVQYRLRIVDEAGRLTENLTPPAHVALPTGDLRRQVLRFPHDIAYPPTSGNAFAARILREIFPVPEEAYGAVGADLYLYNLVPLSGPVVSLEGEGGYYRAHGANNHHVGAANLLQTRNIILRSCLTHRYIKRRADVLGLTPFPADPAAVRSVTFLAHRMVSLKLEPEGHPLKQDHMLRLWVCGLIAAAGRFDVPLRRKLLYCVWFTAMLLAPRSLVPWLADVFVRPEQAGLHQLVAVFYRRPSRAAV